MSEAVSEDFMSEDDSRRLFALVDLLGRIEANARLTELSLSGAIEKLRLRGAPSEESLRELESVRHMAIATVNQVAPYLSAVFQRVHVSMPPQEAVH